MFTSIKVNYKDRDKAEDDDIKTDGVNLLISSDEDSNLTHK